MTNIEYAQEISSRIGTSPVPFESVYSLALSIYQELGGTEDSFDDIYSILLDILPLATEVAHIIDDNITSTGKTWSSSKIVAEMADIDFSISIVQELPQSGDSHTIYFVPASTSGVTNVYDEYMYISNTWEMIGSTAIDLTDYATKIYVNNGLALKQNTLSAGTNISIDSANTISALGYVYDATKNSFACGQNTQATGGLSFACGERSRATAGSTHAEGVNTWADGYYAHAEGYQTRSGGQGSHAEGYSGYGNQLNIKATGKGAHAEGYVADSNEITLASGDGSHAEGRNTTASGNYSHAEGFRCVASAATAHAEGSNTKAFYNHSHAEGYYTTTSNQVEHAQGGYNKSHGNSTLWDGNSGNTIHSIGIGLADSARTNAVEVMQNGDYYIKGVGNYDGKHIKGESGAPSDLRTLQEYLAYLEARIAALEPEPAQPNNEIWYTTSDGNAIDLSDFPNLSPIYFEYDTGGEFWDWHGCSIVSNNYSNGKGVLVCGRDIEGLDEYSFWYNGEDDNPITSISLPSTIKALSPNDGDTVIKESALDSCSLLTELKYTGTKSAFMDMYNDHQLGYEWCNSALTKITCSDGYLNVSNGIITDPDA